jgi:hypothetical protein
MNEADAKAAHRALALFSTLVLPSGVKWEAHTAGEDLEVEARAPLDYLNALF